MNAFEFLLNEYSNSLNISYLIESCKEGSNLKTKLFIEFNEEIRFNLYFQEKVLNPLFVLNNIPIVKSIYRSEDLKFYLNRLNARDLGNNKSLTNFFFLKVNLEEYIKEISVLFECLIKHLDITQLNNIFNNLKSEKIKFKKVLMYSL